MHLIIDGMGIVFFSAKTMEYVSPGTDFLSDEFTVPQQIADHINKGDITAFCTGTSGEFDLHFSMGDPTEEILKQYPVSVRLALEVQDGSVQFCDLFWLSAWNPDFPAEQIISLANGCYDVMVCTRRPESGYWGEDQTIHIYFHQVDQMPKLNYKGVPYLFTEE